MSGNGHRPTGDVAGKIAHRPGLEDLRSRQHAAIAAIEEPLQLEDLAEWKLLVVEACLGRIPEGLRYILADPHLATMTAPFYARDDDVGRMWRLRLQELLGVAFAYPIEDASRLAGELFPHAGMGLGGVQVLNGGGATFR